MTDTNGTQASVESIGQAILDKLPAHVTFADLQAATGGKVRASAMRRYLRENVQAYNERAQRNTVLDKSKPRDRALILHLIGRVGAGTQAGLKTPNSKDNDAMFDAMGLKLPANPVAAQAQASAAQAQAGTVKVG